MKGHQDLNLPEIKDKFDTESAEHIVLVGFPRNADCLPELISWSCFPNDPVCWITYPYISSLRNEVLAPAMAKFLEFQVEVGQYDLIYDAFSCFINEREEPFRKLIEKYLQSDEAKSLFSDPKYMIETIK
jgi:hypothetical protein